MYLCLMVKHGVLNDVISSLNSVCTLYVGRHHTHKPVYHMYSLYYQCVSFSHKMMMM